MEKFSKSKSEFNPYTNTFKANMYSIIKNTLKTNEGQLYGIEEIVENIYEMYEKDLKEYNIELLNDIKDGILESEEKVEIEDDFSSKINSIKKGQIEDNEEQSIVSKGTEELNPEPLTESQINNFIKKINS